MRPRPDLVLLVALLAATPIKAADFATIREAHPELFHERTGFRIDRQRAPTPDDIPPPARRIEADQVGTMLDSGAIAIDVYGALQSRYDELDGTWLVREPRETLPGATWLPEVGRGVLTPDIQSYLETNLAALTNGDHDRPLIVFCVADCWMGWNAAQRIAGLGYNDVSWFRLGTDGWLDEGWNLEPTEPVPVDVD